MNDTPWFEIRVGFMADSMPDAEDILDRLLELLPYPDDFISEVRESHSLSAGEGFGDS